MREKHIKAALIATPAIQLQEGGGGEGELLGGC